MDFLFAEIEVILGELQTEGGVAELAVVSLAAVAILLGCEHVQIGA